MTTGSFRTRLVVRSVAFVTVAVLTSLSCAHDQRDLTAPSRQRPSFELTSGDNPNVQFNITPNPATSAAAAALAQDGSKISVRGVGAFVPGDPEVSGGGSWETRDPSGNVTGSGTWQASRLLKFDFAPGAIANPAIRAGLAFLQVTYSDGSQGVLAVSCDLPGTPASVAKDGIIASKGFALYWNHIQASPTFFVVLANDQ